VPRNRIEIVDLKGSVATYRVSPMCTREHCAICGTTLWIKDLGWENPNKGIGYIAITVGSMNKEDAKKWISLKHHIFLGDTINGGVWEFQDNLPKCAAMLISIDC